VSVTDRPTADPLRPLKVEEVVQLLGMGRDTVLALIRSGQIAAIAAGADYRVPRRCIEAYYDNLARAAAPATPAVVPTPEREPAAWPRRRGRPPNTRTG